MFRVNNWSVIGIGDVPEIESIVVYTNIVLDKDGNKNAKVEWNGMVHRFKLIEQKDEWNDLMPKRFNEFQNSD